MKNIKNRIEELKLLIKDFSVYDHANYEYYDELLDSEGLITVCGYEYYPSQILKEVDPVAYSCGFNDYIEGIDLNDVPEYNDLTNELEELMDQLEELE